jgi:TRAP-type mannitol/chloroaromatic compound transport system permease large subunit
VSLTIMRTLVSTEASGIGAFGATLLAIANWRLDAETLKLIMDRSVRTVAMVFLIILGAMTFSYVFRSRTYTLGLSLS